jgi:hypothetical protein
MVLQTSDSPVQPHYRVFPVHPRPPHPNAHTYRLSIFKEHHNSTQHASTIACLASPQPQLLRSQRSLTVCHSFLESRKLFFLLGSDFFDAPECRADLAADRSATCCRPNIGNSHQPGPRGIDLHGIGHARHFIAVSHDAANLRLGAGRCRGNCSKMRPGKCDVSTGGAGGIRTLDAGFARILP